MNRMSLKPEKSKVRHAGYLLICNQNQENKIAAPGMSLVGEKKQFFAILQP